MQAPTPPDTMDPELWAQYTKDMQAYQATRFSLAGDIDSLFGAAYKDVKNPDGTPMQADSFSKIALGTDRTGFAAKLGESTQNGKKLDELVKQRGEAEKNYVAAVQAGGASNNPEADRWKKQLDALDAQISPTYKAFTGLDWRGSSTDYVALEKTANARGASDATMKALGAFEAESPEVAALLAYAREKNIPLSFNMDLSKLGVQGDSRTLGQFLKDLRGSLNLEELYRTDPAKALAYYYAMSPEERAKDPTAQTIQAELAKPSGERSKVL